MHKKYNQPPLRSVQIEKLKAFLFNPGHFSILVLGKHGVGKSYWLNQLQKDNKGKKCLKSIKTINCGYKNDLSPAEWQSEFEEAKDGLLVFDDAHKLSKKSQEIIFEILSTHNGKFGLTEKNIYCRIAFTSTLSINSLRENREYWNAEFFDRVAQLIVELPAYEKGSVLIKNDFKEVWKNMKFAEHNNLPESGLVAWLENQGNELHGNIRDLEKIAINWHQYRLMEMEDESIADKIKNDFKNYFHYPTQRQEATEGFFLHSGSKWEVIEKDFKAFVKNWAKAEYGNLKSAANIMGISYRTFDRW